jgi:hypothetical protein
MRAPNMAIAQLCCDTARVIKLSVYKRHDVDWPVRR